jgi:hypothetical protein
LTPDAASEPAVQTTSNRPAPLAVVLEVMVGFVGSVVSERPQVVFPVPVLYFPVKQAEQVEAPAAEKVYCAQAAQLVWPVKPFVDVPAAHEPQALVPPAENLPAPQMVQVLFALAVPAA